MAKSLIEARQAAYKRQAGLCFYCDCPLALDIDLYAQRYGVSASQAKRHKCTAEHLHARCDGGHNGKDNIVAACLFCNCTRHACSRPLDPSNFRMKVQRRMAQHRWHPEYVFTRLLQERYGICRRC